MKYHQAKKKNIVLEIISFFILWLLGIIGTVLCIQGTILGLLLFGMSAILILLLVGFVHWDQDRFYKGKER